MIKLYRDDDLWDAVIQRRKILAVFAGVTAAFAAVFVTLTALYTQLPYADPTGPWYVAAVCVAAAAYLIFTFPFMGIKFKRSNAYCKMLRFISAGLKEQSFMPFEDIEDWITHDGVDCNVAVFAARNIKKDEPMRRQIYVDGEKEFPPFVVGRYVRIISQGNLLIEYEMAD